MAPRVIKPDPDPTVITTKNLLREIKHLRKLVKEQFRTQTVRTNGIEHRLDHKYIETADAIKNLRELTEEKFKGLDELTKQSREDAKTRLDTAFKSAHDSQAQDRASFTKQIDNLSEKVETVNKATNEKIDRERSRADTGEGRGLATDRDRQERAVDRGQNINVGQAMIALAGVLLAAAVFFSKGG